MFVLYHWTKPGASSNYFVDDLATTRTSGWNKLCDVFSMRNDSKSWTADTPISFINYLVKHDADYARTVIIMNQAPTLKQLEADFKETHPELCV